jgi:Xaa-Pro aminopeptidase
VSNDKLSAAIAVRLEKLRRKLEEQRVDAILVTMIDNVRYLSGFSGSTATAVVSASEAVLLVDPRYTLQANEECRHFEIREYRNKVIEVTAELIGSLGVERPAFEADYLSFSNYDKLRSLLSSGVELLPSSRVVDDLRLIKDSYEIALMQEAISISDVCFNEILGYIKPGLTERDVALQLEICMRKRGAEKPAFDSIVATGPHAALPHAQPSDAVIQHGQLLKMDYGAQYRQYPSDITRTVCLGEPDSKQREVYNTVLGAQLKAIDAIRSGVAGKDVDSVARDYIAAAGYGDYFGHGLGHSLGRGVHDGPGLSQSSEIVLEQGMVMTVEPGIYIPGWGGVRIEDDVLVTEDGCEILTHATKELLAL